ncbi:MAG: metallophosphoesterase family protein, partial [Myxococcota bacterium]|nr:metallophosphoesterase family protein [Myxococcota bacterium]
LLKGPYLQAPEPEGITIAYETNLEVQGAVIVWGEDENCPVAVVKTPPTKMPTFYEPLGIQMDDTPGWQHAARIEGLMPGKRYTYQVRTGATDSNIYSFKATPPRGEPFTVTLSGDNRTHDADHQRVVDAMLLEGPDLAVNTGDMMSASGMLSDWEGFFAIESELVSQTPLMPCFGNHEAVLGDAYYAGYFHVPGAKNDSKKDYAYPYGDTFWITLDSNLPLEDEELVWLEEQFKRAADYPYLFVAFHHPFFTFSKHVPDTQERDRLHPLFVEYGVSAVWSGHNHCYERFMVDGIPYVVTGGGGSSLYGTDSHVVPGEEHLRVVARSTHHYVTLSVSPEGTQAMVMDIDAEEQLDSFLIAPRSVD